MAGKDIYADVACVGTGAGTATNPYCALSQAFLDAGSSSGMSNSTFPSGVVALDPSSPHPFVLQSSTISNSYATTGDVTVHIAGSWLITPLFPIIAPSFSSLTVVPWFGAEPSIK